MKATSQADGKCTAATAAMISLDTTLSYPCDTYNYPSGNYYYINDAAAMAVCLTCTAATYSVVGSTSTSTYGKCKSLSNVQAVCGNYKYLQAIPSSTINFCYDSTD